MGCIFWGMKTIVLIAVDDEITTLSHALHQVSATSNRLMHFGGCGSGFEYRTFRESPVEARLHVSKYLDKLLGEREASPPLAHFQNEAIDRLDLIEDKVQVLDDLIRRAEGKQDAILAQMTRIERMLECLKKTGGSTGSSSSGSSY